jgi:dTDP-glucose 4,6-dehydratase
MLVTGAAGFIGSNFVHFWAEQHTGDVIVGLDALTYAGNLASLEPLAKNEKFTFIKGDIRDGDAVHEIISIMGSIRSSTSPRNRTSIDRSTALTRSSTRM